MPVNSGERVESEAGATPSASARDATRREDRSRTVRFVILFVVYVLTLLTGYRFAIDTETNMRYLFSVAKHSSAALSLFGEKSTLETAGMSGADTKSSPHAAAKRSELREWRSGGAASAEDEGEDDAPLTPLESWLHRGYSMIQEGKSLHDQGPLVYFRAKTGLNSKISSLRIRIKDTGLDTAIPLTERDALAKELEAELKGLEDERGALREESESGRTGQNKSFTFTLVPDCGAIPSISIFLAAVLAFPTAWWRRIAGLVLGLPFLYGVNVGRLTFLGTLAAYDTTPGRQWFTFFHEYVWQGVFIIFVVAAWLVWMEFFVKRRPA
ncbi:MAG: exosortase/archaeosortase family protein [Candidatus Hydrogenedentes bacterium]|nr:exosortase/archaeosortase family protein [Candidatus Hydrogenedentota bacterium]